MNQHRSILLHLDETARAPNRIRYARGLAEALDAEVICRPCSLSDLMLNPFTVGAAAQVVDVMRALERQALDKLFTTFIANSEGSPRMRWMESESAAPWEFSQHALYADLILLGQRDKNDPMDHLLPPDFVPSQIIQSGRPSLVLPFAGDLRPVGRCIVVAWNESSEAARALTAALPWLKTAHQVHAVTYGGEAARPLKRLQRYLESHGITNTTIHPDERNDDVGNRLLSLCADVDADLLVMGCYGHSRAREWAMGGATRCILDSMTLPVLLSH